MIDEATLEALVKEAVSGPHMLKRFIHEVYSRIRYRLGDVDHADCGVVLSAIRRGLVEQLQADRPAAKE